MPEWVATAQTSDWILFAIAIALFIFATDYGAFAPWWKSPLGWIIFGYGLSMLMFTGLILYAVITGERASEAFRIPIMLFVLSMIIGKEVMLQVLRRQGRIERRERRRREAVADPQEGTLMSEAVKPLTVEEIVDATTIWYKAQRVARTAVAALISSLSAWAGFVAIFPQVSAELAKVLPGSWITWLTASVASVTVVASAITGIMAIPKVNAFLTKWLNLGSVPKKAIAVETIKSSETGGLQQVPFVLPDEKDKSRIGAIPSPIPESAPVVDEVEAHLVSGTGDDRG